jgi:hypothetical protein
MGVGWEQIEGAKEFVEWFGSWPSFHDAEVIHLHLNRTGTTSLLIHTWEMTGEVLPSGFYSLRKHVEVELLLEEVRDLELADFNQQNVIFGLNVEPVESGLRVSLDGCYGIAGHLEAKSAALRFTPLANS